MLVLSRKCGEEIVIGGVIRVKVGEICGQRVRIAIEAPKHVPIHRHETALQIAAAAGLEPALTQ